MVLPSCRHALYKMYDLAITSETIDGARHGLLVIRRQSRDQAVVISPQEYAPLRGLTERKLASLLRTGD